MTEPDTERPQLSVVIVDADERVRESLAGLLVIGRRCIVVACAGDAEGALELIDSYRPNVVLLDPRLPELDTGRVVVTTIRQRWPSTRVVALGVADVLDEAGFAGAVDGYVRKSFRPKELLDAIAAAAGSREPHPVHPSVALPAQN